MGSRQGAVGSSFLALSLCGVILGQAEGATRGSFFWVGMGTV